MNFLGRTSQRSSLLVLRFTLGIVILGQAIVFALHDKSRAAFADTGLHSWIRPALAWSEILAALLFLLPWTMWLGAWLLLIVLLSATTLHFALGEIPGSLLVYVAAVVVVMVHRSPADHINNSSSPRSSADERPLKTGLGVS